MEANNPTFTLTVIGFVRSCFAEKFGIPRQSGMVRSAPATIVLHPPFDREEMWRGLDQFSHLWIHFLFHQAVGDGWKSTVRPPRLGGKKRLGVFATRSPHRPNHLGLSVVRLVAVTCIEGSCSLEVAGADILDNSPVIDIKPYLPYSDSITEAHGGANGFGNGFTADISVEFSQEAGEFCGKYQRATGRDLKRLIGEMIRHDPRPASQMNRKKEFGMLLWDVNVRWRVVEEGKRVMIKSCEQTNHL